ncbi:MAG: hypothetical protein J6K04_13385 [Lachnospiraceae bacterium]|nr:hypothetical protein [Lachnospiraceae bacterium]
MDNAILHAGVDELNTIKEHVLELTGYQERNAELLKEEARLEKLIATKEKDLNDEIETTLKKRKNELVSTYEAQLDTLNARSKKVKAKKEKDKDAKMSERMEEETADLRDRNKELVLEIKAKMKADKTPKICNTTLFYACFMPKSPIEFLIFIAGLLIVFLAIPFSIYQLPFAKKFGEIALAVIYLIMILLVGSVYLAINNKVKEKHLDTIRAVRGLRNQYYRNLKNVKDIQRGIKNDSDESSYGLEQYDAELSEITAEIQRVTEEEKKALNTFETETTAQIKAEAKERYEEELANLREKCKETEAEQKTVEEKVKEYSLMMSQQYEAYLGRDMLTVSKLDKLISRIQKGEAADIGEAIALEKNR